METQTRKQKPLRGNRPDRLPSFGRRAGRSLNELGRALLEPGVSPHLLPPAISEPIALSDWFPGAVAHAIEIGFGGGEHVLAQAKSNPNVGYIACEVFQNGVANLLQNLNEQSVDNVKVFKGDARDVLDHLPSQSLNYVYILFPDPWPKIRHHKRRIINGILLKRLTELLKIGGRLRIATDHWDYTEWIFAQISRHPRLVWQATSRQGWEQPPPDHITTRYEEKSRKSNAPRFGKQICYLDFVVT